jgi:hypothetical protein
MPMNAPKNETIKGCTLELEGKNDIGNLHNYFREYRAVAKTMSGWRRVLASLGAARM